MKLVIRVEHGKDATGIEKRVIFSSLRTDIPGMEKIDAVAELTPGCGMAKEVDKLVTNMLSLKQMELKQKHGDKVKKLKNERKHILKKS